MLLANLGMFTKSCDCFSKICDEPNKKPRFAYVFASIYPQAVPTFPFSFWDDGLNGDCQPSRKARLIWLESQSSDGQRGYRQIPQFWRTYLNLGEQVIILDFLISDLGKTGATSSPTENLWKGMKPAITCGRASNQLA